MNNIPIGVAPDVSEHPADLSAEMSEEKINYVKYSDNYLISSGYIREAVISRDFMLMNMKTGEKIEFNIDHKRGAELTFWYNNEWTEDIPEDLPDEFREQIQTAISAGLWSDVLYMHLIGEEKFYKNAMVLVQCLG